MSIQFNELSPEMQNVYKDYCISRDLTGLTLSNVILDKDNKQKLEEFLHENNNKEHYMKYGYAPVNRMLFYGASGTGKTFLTKCLAADLGFDLLSIDIANALSKGVAAQSIESIFKLANKSKNCIIFLDECDAIARDRTSTKVAQSEGMRLANNAIFQQLDDMDPSNIFIAATNLLSDLDPAFIRRFDIKMKFERPDINELDSYIRKFVPDSIDIEDDFDKDIKAIILTHLPDYTGLSFDEIEIWCERATKKAIDESIEHEVEPLVFTSSIYHFLMQALRYKIDYNKNGKPYIYQE